MRRSSQNLNSHFMDFTQNNMWLSFQKLWQAAILERTMEPMLKHTPLPRCIEMNRLNLGGHSQDHNLPFAQQRNSHRKISVKWLLSINQIPLNWNWKPVVMRPYYSNVKEETTIISIVYWHHQRKHGFRIVFVQWNSVAHCTFDAFDNGNFFFELTCRQIDVSCNKYDTNLDRLIDQ